MIDFARLRDALSTHIPDKLDIPNICETAGLSSAEVNFDGSAVVVWADVLRVAQRRGREQVRSLLESVLSVAGGTREVKEALHQLKLGAWEDVPEFPEETAHIEALIKKRDLQAARSRVAQLRGQHPEHHRLRLLECIVTLSLRPVQELPFKKAVELAEELVAIERVSAVLEIKSTAILLQAVLSGAIFTPCNTLDPTGGPTLLRARARKIIPWKVLAPELLSPVKVPPQLKRWWQAQMEERS